MSRLKDTGSTRAWRLRRAEVLARDGHLCRMAIPGVCVTRSTPMHVHHLHGRLKCTGCANDLPDHLVAACEPCNLHIGEPPDTDPAPRPLTKWG